jgi:DNA invertase Pin-like site-specific DNA recombinase
MTEKAVKVVTYKRVSRQSQGLDGLGMAAQQKLLDAYVANNNARVIGEFEEVKSGLKARPALKAAIAKARATRSVLLIAKLDRAGRRASEVLTLLDRSDVKVVFADMPNASALQLGILAVVAQEEARAISVRTKAALAVARENGMKLGGPNGAAPLVAYVKKHGNVAATQGGIRAADKYAREVVGPYLETLTRTGMTDAAIATTFNVEGIETRREGGVWYKTSIRRVRVRLGL